MNLVAPIAIASSQRVQAVTVLNPFDPNHFTVKRYRLDESGAVACDAYGNAASFYHRQHPISDVHTLGALIETLSSSRNTILIRGLARHELHRVASRNTENFQEAPAGCQWVMIDFDNLPLPLGVNPTGRDAIEYCVAKLPPEFRSASYFFQHSSSAGIVADDGVAYKNKTGLNAHVFFWLSNPIPGNFLAAYLQDHCIDTGFYEKVRNSGNVPMIRYGVDLSVIKTAVQPHYVGLPIIEAGVTCTLNSTERQGLVRKCSDAVVIPALRPDIERVVFQKHRLLREDWCRQCGLIKVRSVTKLANGGIAVSTHFTNPDASARVGREFLRAEFYGLDAKAIRLYFADEGTPGSWCVVKTKPQLAFRFGDGATLHLKELSQGAYEHVRDALSWFSEVTCHTLQLGERGYLPSLASFAHAKASLILAPTGSGKTHAFVQYALANRNKIIIYAAPTIALGSQTMADLRGDGVSARHYQDYRGEQLVNGVYVTTYKSLPRFVKAAERDMIQYELVLDEIHAGLDESMRNGKLLERFENAIGRAAKILFLTATITPLQQKKLTEVVGAKVGGLDAANFSVYEFLPVKANPLFICDLSDFAGNVVALFRRCGELKAQEGGIPRTVIMVPETKMRRFEILLSQHGLKDDAYVVSRPESTQAEIELARVGTLPILISSPLFALGMNFAFEPEYLWAYFDHIEADTTQIIQTLNRANRGETVCEVRLYIRGFDVAPIMISPQLEGKLKSQIELNYREEASLDGLLDMHFTVDRMTYCGLRDLEKNTAKSLGQLISDDAFQNYRIADHWDEHLSATKDDAEAYKDAKAVAKASYKGDVVSQARRYDKEVAPLIFHRLDQLYEDRKTAGKSDGDRTEREIETEEKGLLMVLCETGEPAGIDRVRPIRLKRLFAEAMPFISEQFDPVRFPCWNTVAAEKTLKIIPLLAELKNLNANKIDGYEFAKRMRNNKGLRAAIIALADNDFNFTQWNKKLVELDEIGQQIRTKAGHAKRLELAGKEFAIAVEFLATVGVRFQKTKGGDGRSRIDPSKPVMPDWNFDLMARNLEIKARALKRLPDGCTILPYGGEEFWVGGAMVRVEQCRRCVYYQHSSCTLGNRSQWQSDEPEVLLTNSCRSFVAIPARLVG